MFFNILKKDLKRKRSMNLILFTFITLCVIFIASSVSNLTSILNAIDYFGEQSNLADYFIFKISSDDAHSVDSLEDWLAANPHVEQTQVDEGVLVNTDNFSNGAYEVMGTLVTVNTLPQTYNLLLDGNDKPLTVVKDGEMAMSRYDAKRNGLEYGDAVVLSIGGREKAFTLTHLTKDMVLGSQYMDMKRLVISDADYAYLAGADGASTLNLYSVQTNDVPAFRKDLRSQGFPLYLEFDASLVEATFTMEMVTSGILILVSVCLIAIAFVVLRFTIVFTLQDDFKEIGIMKALGITNAYIKRLYIIKYFALALLGATLGTILSVPFGNLMIQNLRENVAMPSATGQLAINVLCGLFMVLLVVLFCWFSANGVNRFTAIQAIRSGSTGERFRGKTLFHLSRSRHTPTLLHMALGSIGGAIRSYGILIFTFILGTLLVVLPLNAVNTLAGDDIVELFGMSKSDVFIKNMREIQYIADGRPELVMEDMRTMEALYADNGLEITLNPMFVGGVGVYSTHPDESESLLAFQSLVHEAGKHDNYIDGTPPLLPNEVAVTELSLKRLGVDIGDSVYVKLGDEAKKYVITASFQSMNNMGSSLYFSKKHEIDFSYAATVIIQGDFTDRSDIKGQIAKLKDVTPLYTVDTSKEAVEDYVGNIIETIDQLKILILAVVIFINCLITILLMRTFITREKGEISLLKNIGFTNRFIRSWQMLRIVILLAASICLGVILSNPLNAVTVRYTFGLMGASKIKLNIIPYEVYFLYPTILFLGTSLAAALGTGPVGKVGFREINDVE